MRIRQTQTQFPPNRPELFNVGRTEMSNNMCYSTSGELERRLRVFKSDHGGNQYFVCLMNRRFSGQPHMVVGDNSDIERIELDFTCPEDVKTERGLKVVMRAVVVRRQNDVVASAIKTALSESGHVTITLIRGQVVGLRTGDTNWVEELKLNLQPA